MELTYELKKQVECTANDAVKLVLHKTFHGKIFGDIPYTIIWKKIGRNIAGRTYLKSKVIAMNINYLKSKDVKEFLEYTVRHELAHLYAYEMFKEAGHGEIWKAICLIMGGNGEAQHRMDRPMIGKVNYLAHCVCRKEFVLSPRIGKNILDGQIYICTKCKSKVEIKKIIQEISTGK